VSHPKKYHFLRWLAECVKDVKKTDDALSGIAYYMMENKSDYLQFNDIFVIDDNVYVYTRRPGLWIGKGGRTIDAIEHRINYNLDGKKFYDFKLQLIENIHEADAEIAMTIRVLENY
jgi:hypothetical protein